MAVISSLELVFSVSSESVKLAYMSYEARTDLASPRAPICSKCCDHPRRRCRACSCYLCGGKDDPEKQILCDECDQAYHLGCLDPPLVNLPEMDEWTDKSVATFLESTDEELIPKVKYNIIEHLRDLASSFRNYFLAPNPENSWIRNCFECGDVQLTAKEQDALVDMTCDGSLKSVFKEYRLNQLWNKHKNCLDVDPDLRLKLENIEPDVEGIVRDKKRHALLFRFIFGRRYRLHLPQIALLTYTGASGIMGLPVQVLEESDEEFSDFDEIDVDVSGSDTSVSEVSSVSENESVDLRVLRTPGTTPNPLCLTSRHIPPTEKNVIATRQCAVVKKIGKERRLGGKADTTIQTVMLDFALLHALGYCPECKNDENEIVRAGEKLKESKRKSMAASKTTSSKRDWGKGMACVGRTKVCTIVPPDHFGPVPGVEVGTSWMFRMQVRGPHRTMNMTTLYVGSSKGPWAAQNHEYDHIVFWFIQRSVGRTEP
ncbi:unnamed protein product [Timema podura]|uniref:Zinc finger PHD-type domain-containing protein n=1 Tax=Timema podura TaxID=61482 RepID=A0ABN7NS06_TIMPD|nr:unnamed protein product [Timema podura]